MVHFKTLFELVEPDIREGVKISKFTSVIMFLMKIRLNLFDEDIAYQFGVHIIFTTFLMFYMSKPRISLNGHIKMFSV